MSVTTQGPYNAGALVTVATWYVNPQGVLTDGFKDRNGHPADPSTITLLWFTPDGVRHSASGSPSAPPAPIVRSATTQGVSLGLFEADLDTTALPGVWQYQWQAPDGDPVQSIEVGSFVVDPVRT
jgi:hypothetical protein